jgi:hypothetical protein
LAGTGGPMATEYYTSSVQKLRVEIPRPNLQAPVYEFYKLMVR